MARNIETGNATAFGDFFGNKLYEQRARLALPLLIRQAKAQRTILYSDLATEIGMPNPRNLNYPLGLIGNVMKNFEGSVESIPPPIQCLVINKNTGLPGEGIGWFVPEVRDFSRLSKTQQKSVVDRMLVEIFAYDQWDAVLEHLGLQPSPSGIVTNSEKIRRKNSTGRGKGGEGPAHKALKNAIARDPSLIGEKGRFDIRTEYPFLSGDSIDVSFMTHKRWIGVEVKGKNSDEADLVRGLYQCVKYNALMDAESAAELRHRALRVVLAIGGKFPGNLVGLKNVLKVEVIDSLQTE